MSGPAPAPGQIVAVGQRLLACASLHLADTEAGAPDHAYLVAGAQVAYDYCHCGGQLTVHVRTSYPSDAFPDQLLRSDTCLSTYTVVEYVLTILRCIEVQNDRGEPPSGPTQTLDAITDWNDRQAVRKAVGCCVLDDGDTRRAKLPMVMQEQLGVGHEGQCAGSELHVLVGLLNCQDC